MSKRIVLLQALSSTSRDLHRSLEGLSKLESHIRPETDIWSPAEIINHLISVEIRSLARLKNVVDYDRPTIQKIWPDQADHNPAKSLGDLLADFENARAQTLRFLTDLSPSDWQRTAVFAHHGETTLRILVQDLVYHDIQHLDQLASVIHALRSRTNRTEATHGR